MPPRSPAVHFPGRSRPAASPAVGDDLGVSAAVDVPALTFRQADIVARQGTGEHPEVMHTVLLALQHRCVIGTLAPAAYHALGYTRTVDLSE